MTLELATHPEASESLPAVVDGAGWATTGEGPDAARRPASRWARLSQALRARRGRVRSRDVVVFLRHLATMLAAGLTLSKSLRTVARQLENSTLSALVAQLADDVESGEMLSSAMALMPDVFDSLVVNIVRAGEVSGTLPETLQELAASLEKSEALRATLLGAMVYPAIVVAIAAIVVGFLLVYVVPIFEGVYHKMHLELPMVTRLLLGVSGIALRFWWVPGPALAGLVFALRRLKGVESFRRRWDALALRVPVFGAVRRKALAARFLGAFATLIGSGVSIVESLRLMSSLASNVVVRDAIDDIRRHVSRGMSMGEPMEHYAGLFSPMAIQMLSVGEQTGSLPEAASRTATFLTQDVDNRLKTMTTLIEPLLTLGLGLVVGTIALAIYLPMFDLMKHVNH